MKSLLIMIFVILAGGTHAKAETFDFGNESMDSKLIAVNFADSSMKWITLETFSTMRANLMITPTRPNSREFAIVPFNLDESGITYIYELGSHCSEVVPEESVQNGFSLVKILARNYDEHLSNPKLSIVTETSKCLLVTVTNLTSGYTAAVFDFTIPKPGAFTIQNLKVFKSTSQPQMP